MEEKFDYAAAMAELEAIAKKVVDRSKALLAACRSYLRSVKEKIDELEG